MFTVLWDNDSVLVEKEGLYFRATQMVLATVVVALTTDQFKEISLKRGESTFTLTNDGNQDSSLPCPRLIRRGRDTVQSR